jgi:ribonuclease BN (tRNA processing enzyme)
MAQWQSDHWQWQDTEPLCSLDAVRFRLPLLHAVARVLRRTTADFVLIDTPGAVRGVGAAELIRGLTESIKVDAVLVLDRPGSPFPLNDDLVRLTCPVYLISAHPAAKRPSATARAKARSQLWNQYLAGANITDLQLNTIQLLGAPPQSASPLAWRGLQVAILRGADLIGMGEVMDRRGDSLRIQLQGNPQGGDCLLVRDAWRDPKGLLVTTPSVPTTNTDRAAEFDSQRALCVGTGAIIAKLVNGVFGDPIVELQLRGARDRVLFDLGDASLLSRRVLHKVTDVFISHAHFDHICGFLHLLRARMTGSYPALRIYGPPGIHEHIIALIGGINWDRIGNAGPEFHIAEISQEHISWSQIKAGQHANTRTKQTVFTSTLLRRSDFSVQCAHLDHGIPVLAFAMELAPQHHICREKLAASRLPPGAWLKDLKRHIANDDLTADITLPNGKRRRADLLSAELVDIKAGGRLVYATDFADTPSNRDTLSTFANEADIFMCEATFCIADSTQAQSTGHITTRACGEIALAANVQRLVPFHFSKRYSDKPANVYAEIRAYSGQTRVTDFGLYR